jgi:beta-lactamase regulating signal transducer with metallopeptidase domain
MKTALEFFSSYSLDVVGHTLLHSLWQGLLILIIVAVALRIIPTKLSNVRYTVATAGLLSMIASSLITFAYLSAGPSDHISFSVSHGVQADVAGTFTGSPGVVATYLSAAQTFIESCMPFFLMIWVAGALIFSLRIFMGLAYVERLREGSVPLGEDLNNCIQEISAKLKIEKLITLAESSAIDAPVVIGYLKPFILIPMGMCACLSTAQLETIFIHELMHIRRKDYLVNLVQSFVEAIYFFNPFVWAISEMVKSEREHCCDDAVVQLQGNATVYASALATLEEVRLSKNTLSLSLAGNKNELLKRIKRLMEKSVQNHYGREKMIPALLLIIGLFCASWISATTGPNESESAYMYSQTVVQDTTKKGKKDKAEKKAQRSRAATPSNDAKEEVEINEQVEVDKDVNVEEHVETDLDGDFSYAPPPLPDFDFHMPPMPELAGMMPPLAELNLLMKDFVPPHPDWNDKDWEKFSEEFEEKFKSKFGDFYEKNEEDIQKMMQEIQQNLNDNFGEDFEAKMQDFAKKQEQWAKAHAEKWEQQAEKMALHGERLEGLGDEMHQRSEKFREEFEKNHKEFEKRHKAFEERSKNFNRIMKEELIKDGYLDSDEKLENIHYHNGVLKINGKAIKAEDQEKYNGIREKYFETPNEPVND